MKITTFLLKEGCTAPNGLLIKREEGLLVLIGPLRGVFEEFKPPFKRERRPVGVLSGEVKLPVVH